MKQGSLLCGCAVLTFAALSGCVPGDSGGGGGLGSFSRGFAFVRDRDIYVVDDSDSSASHPLQLTTTGNNRNPSLSKDGRRVVFVRSGAELWVVNPTTDPRATQVPLGSTPVANVRTPVFSPDGNTIVFAYDVGGVSALAKVNVDGSGAATLTPQSRYYASPSFYPNGSAVLAAKGVTPAYNELVSIDINSGGETPIVTSLGPQACAIVNRVALSPNATKIAFDARSGSGCAGAARIFVADLTSGAVNRLTFYPAEPGATDAFPTWVGNQQVGYSSDVGGGNNVYSLNTSVTDQSGPLRVPTASEPYYGPNS